MGILSLPQSWCQVARVVAKPKRVRGFFISKSGDVAMSVALVGWFHSVNGIGIDNHQLIGDRIENSDEISVKRATTYSDKGCRQW